MCIRVFGSNKKSGTVGDSIIEGVKSSTPYLSIKRLDIVRAVILRPKLIVKMVRVLMMHV